MKLENKKKFKRYLKRKWPKKKKQFSLNSIVHVHLLVEGNKEKIKILKYIRILFYFIFSVFILIPFKFFRHLNVISILIAFVS